MINKLFKILLLVALPFWATAQKYQLKPLFTDAKTSMRGLSVVNKNVIWVSGSRGTIGKSIDGGKTWQWIQPKGYEKLDFRDIQAFDHQKAIVVNAGSPAYILSTVDGGKTWRENYKNIDSAAFFNGMDFWDGQNGMVFGDPMNHKMQLLRTDDGGLTWKNISEQLKKPMQVGEAGFAASGTSIKTAGNGKVWIATGGVVSNIYHSANYGKSWKVFKCPILQGESSTGVFSIDFFDENNGVAVGGNYLNDKDNQNNVLLTHNGGKKWKKPDQPVSGYRSGVVFVTKDFLVATGTSGTDISTDGGKRWQNISNLSFNAVKTADGLVVLVGGKGNIYRLDTVL
ncbi:YCF48-related protein [Pedobacter sp.]|uniref:WD40/YVTN/BNR-like repeat-containing protein n=1 Tax=Pedobacter sp. TaxID=1411316 RepID=UPI0031D118CF